MKKVKRTLLWAALSSLVLGGCAPDNPSGLARYRETRLLLGTVIHLDVCYEPHRDAAKDAAFRKVWQRLEEIDLRMNVYNPESDLVKISQGYPRAVTVHPDTWQVIQEAQAIGRLSGGTFDITVGPLVDVWKRAARENLLPDAKEIVEVRRTVGSGNVELLPSAQVRIKTPQVRVDLGGIAKGYAVDEVARIFRENGFENFYLDAGGNIYVGGLNCEKRSWHIGIRDPQDRSRITDIVAVSNVSVATSGSYEQHFEIGGRTWSHILNPLTGYPLESQEGGFPLASATVIAPQGAWADGLATALNVLPPQEGLNLIKSLGEDYAASVTWWDGRQGRYVTSATPSFAALVVRSKNP